MSRTACLNGIYELAKTDPRVVFIGTDLTSTTLENFKKDFPDRYYMFGIQEQNIAGVAAGLALDGFIPYIVNIASFLTRRCYEQIAVDICAHNLPVRLCGYGGGLVYTSLGLTHCAIEDIAIMRALPNMSVICCSDSDEMTKFMPSTVTNLSPMYIRLGKDSDPKPFVTSCDHDNKIFIMSTGIMTNRAIKIPNANVKHISTIKPLPNVFIPPKTRMIVTMEEGIRNGGLGTAVLESMSDNNVHLPVLRFGLPDAFPHHFGEQEDLLETYGLTVEKMAKKIEEFYDKL